MASGVRGALRVRSFDGALFDAADVREVIVWRLLVAEQALILLLGGSLLTWVVRRERRRKAAAG